MLLQRWFPSPLQWASDVLDTKTRQMQTAAHISPAVIKRGEASKWSPEAVFQTESSPGASKPPGKASPGSAKHHHLLQTFHLDFGAARWSWGWLWPPRLALLHLQDTAVVASLGLHTTLLHLAHNLNSTELKELGEAVRNWFSSCHRKHELLHKK